MIQNLNPQCTSWNFSAVGKFYLVTACLWCRALIHDVSCGEKHFNIPVTHTLGGRGNWTTDGCELTGIDGNVTICECNHLTNFAVLVVCKRYIVWSIAKI